MNIYTIYILFYLASQSYSNDLNWDFLYFIYIETQNIYCIRT